MSANPSVDSSFDDIIRRYSSSVVDAPSTPPPHQRLAADDADDYEADVAVDAEADSAEAAAIAAAAAYHRREQTQQQPEESNDFALLTNSDVVVRCPHCRTPFRERSCEVDVGVLFPVPTKHRVLLSVIGSTDIQEGLPRTVEETANVLRTLRALLHRALDPDMKEELDFDLLAPPHPAGLPPAADLARLATVPGAVDFLVASGFDRMGSGLNFWREPKHRPCQRALIGLAHVADELESMGRDGKAHATQPVMSQIGKYLTLFESLQNALDSGTRFPTFDELQQWIETRNFFYTCVVIGGADQAETWIEYFATARDMCQQVLERVESFHKALRIDGGLSTLLRHSTALRQLAQYALGSTPPSQLKRRNPYDSGSDYSSFTDTPPQHNWTSAGGATGGGGGGGGSSASSKASPLLYSPGGDFLTRTPPKGVDRDYFRASAPPLEDSWRDPATDAAGLLNIRQCCFVNCVMQMLFRDRVFLHAVMVFPRADVLRRILTPNGDPGSSAPSPSSGPPLPRPYKVAHRLQSLFAFMKMSAASAINPAPVLDAVASCAPQFSDGGQHDPHEFAAALVEILSSAFDDVVTRLAALSNGPTSCDTDEGVPTAANVATCLGDDDLYAMRDEPPASAPASDSAAAVAAERSGVLRELLAARRAFDAHTSYATTAAATLLADGAWSSTSTTADGDDVGDARSVNGNSSNTRSSAFLPLYVDEDERAERRRVFDAQGAPVRRHADPAAECLASTPPAAAASESDDAKQLTDLHWCLDAALGDYRDVAGCAAVGSLLTFADPHFSATTVLRAPPALVFYLPSRCQGGGASVEKAAAPFSYPPSIDLGVYGADAVAVERRKAMLELRHKQCTARREAAAAANALEALKQAAAAAPPMSPLAAQIDAAVQMATATHAQRAADATSALREYGAALSRFLNEPHKAADAGATTAQLQAVIVHVGKTTVQGHYVSYVREDGPHGRGPARWLRCDDVSVEEVPASVVFSLETQRDAYCLSYALPPAVEMQMFAEAIPGAGAARIFSSTLRRAASGASADAASPSPSKALIPPGLARLIEKEDLRRQLRHAQRLSAEMGE